MKPILILLISFFSFYHFSLQAQESFFDKFSSEEEVNSFVINKRTIELTPNLKKHGIDIRSLINNLEDIKILTSNNSCTIENMVSATELFFTYKEYTNFLEVKDKEKCNLNFYIKNDKIGENSIEELILIINENSNFIFIQFNGNFTLDEIRKMIKTSSYKT